MSDATNPKWLKVAIVLINEIELRRSIATVPINRKSICYSVAFYLDGLVTVAGQIGQRECATVTG